MQRIAILITTLFFFLSLSGCTNHKAIDSNAKSPEPSGDELRLMLYKKINNHKVLGYNNLWMYFPKTDLLKNTADVVWDIYSYKESKLPYQFIYGKDQCGNYQKEGDCYNREHSFPQSWLGGGQQPPMKSDLFHIYPTDGKVNALRANYPYGEVKTGAGTITTENGSKLGQSATDCYKGTVFEPVDEFKGDLARGYFYLLTRYMPQISSWKTPVLEDNNFSSCFKTLLLKWSEEDPVSEKERLRNEIIENLQGNYNPFIKDPSLIEKVWTK